MVVLLLILTFTDDIVLFIVHLWHMFEEFVFLFFWGGVVILDKLQHACQAVANLWFNCSFFSSPSLFGLQEVCNSDVSFTTGFVV